MGEHEYRPPPDDLAERIEDDEVRPQRRKHRRVARVWAGIAVVFAVLACGFGFNATNNVRQDREDDATQVELDAQKDQLDATYTVAKRLEKQLLAAGETPDSPPVDTVAKNPDVVKDPQTAPQPPVEGRQGEPGRAPTAEEISQAVAAYCAARSRCIGADGKPGADGDNATPEQVAAAVATYCDSRGECEGPGGKSGVDGQDGADGADGAQGPPPSDADVLAAVAAFCGDDKCRGAKGDPGEPGKDSTVPGPAGPEGPAGKPGYPASWTFQWLGTSWLCVDADNDHAYACETT